MPIASAGREGLAAAAVSGPTTTYGDRCPGLIRELATVEYASSPVSRPERPVGSGKPKPVQRELAGRSVCLNWAYPWVRRKPWGGPRGGGLRP